MPERGIQGLIQTIVSLRQLQLQEAAQELQRQQVGISQGNLALAQSQRPLNTIAALQGVLGHTDNPAAFSSYAPQFAQMGGVGTDMMQNIISHTPAAAATTRDRAVQIGAGQVDLSRPAAFSALTGAGEGDLARDNLFAKMFGDTGDYYSSLPSDRKNPFVQGVLQKVGTGQSLTDAAKDVATSDYISHADKATRDLIAKIGLGQAPDASTDAQLRLGYERFRLDQRQFEFGAQMDELKLRAAAENSKHMLDAKAFEEVNNIIAHRSELLTNFMRNNPTMTPEGRRSYIEQLNAFNAQMRNAAPKIYGKGGTNEIADFPMDTDVSASGLFEFMRGRLRQP